MKDLGRRLLDLKERLEKAKERRSETQGELRSIMKQLKESFGVDSLPEAEELLQSEERILLELEQSLKDQMEELEEVMEGL